MDVHFSPSIFHPLLKSGCPFFTIPLFRQSENRTPINWKQDENRTPINFSTSKWMPFFSVFSSLLKSGCPFFTPFPPDPFQKPGRRPNSGKCNKDDSGKQADSPGTEPSINFSVKLPVSGLNYYHISGRSPSRKKHWAACAITGSVRRSLKSLCNRLSHQ